MSHQKLGRNDPCWCKSGKKYKRCHLDRELQTPMSRAELVKATESAFWKLKCSAPEAWHASCDGRIVQAHTVQKASSLRQIARDGHIYGFVTNIDPYSSRDRIEPSLIGLSRASTFTGFCSGHDNQIFREIETSAFAATPEQCFLLDYRAMCWELYAKEGLAAGDDVRRQCDRGRPLAFQEMWQRFCTDFQTGISLGLRNLSWHKQRRDELLVSRDFPPVRAYVITLDHPPPVMCSGAFIPEQDFLGRNLVRLPSFGAIPAYVSVSSFHGGDSGVVVFGWLEPNDSVNIPFIESLAGLPDEGLGDALLRLFFEMSENTYMAPDWWEQLSGEVQEAVIDRMNYSGIPINPRKPGALTDDGVRFPGWSVAGRRCVGFDL